MKIKTCQCGNGIAQGSDADLCLYCRSKLTHCCIDAREYTNEGDDNFEIPVRWCTQKGCRLMYADCKDCEYYSEEKILPEVE